MRKRRRSRVRRRIRKREAQAGVLGERAEGGDRE